jgi:hypothetical protein
LWSVDGYWGRDFNIRSPRDVHLDKDVIATLNQIRFGGWSQAVVVLVSENERNVSGSMFTGRTAFIAGF